MSCQPTTEELRLSLAQAEDQAKLSRWSVQVVAPAREGTPPEIEIRFTPASARGLRAAQLEACRLRAKMRAREDRSAGGES